MSEWQPIETAPTDTRDLVLLGEGKRIYVGYFSWGSWGDLSENITNPTHWMPLPEPPEVKP